MNEGETVKMAYSSNTSALSGWALDERRGEGCSCSDSQAPLNCVIHLSGSQMSLHARLHSKRAIIYANSAALEGITEAPGF